MSHAFTISQMWRVSQRNNNTWGIEGYEAPRKYADARLIKWKRDIGALPAGKYLQGATKYITKKGHYLDFQYKSQNVSKPKGAEGGGKLLYTPGPAKYQKTIGKVADELKAKGKVKQAKLDMTTQRKDMVWQIIHDSKMAPERGRKRPGPGSYFQDSKNKEEKKPEKGGKSDKINFLMEYEHMSAQVPGPGQYYPRKCQPHHNIRGVKPNPFNVEYFRKKHKVGQKKPKKEKCKKEDMLYPEQLKYKTFRKQKMIHAKGPNTIKKFWGSSKRFRYQRGVFDKAAKKPAKKGKGKTGPIGPGSYNIGSVWGLDEKSVLKSKDIQKKRTKGVYKSIYY